MCIVCEYASFPVNGAATLSNMSVAASHTLDGCMCPSHPLNGRVTSCSGSTVTYTCNSGYVNHGSSWQRCQSGRYGYRWSWSPPSCVKRISKWAHDTEWHCVNMQHAIICNCCHMWVCSAFCYITALWYVMYFLGTGSSHAHPCPFHMNCIICLMLIAFHWMHGCLLLGLSAPDICSLNVSFNNWRIWIFLTVAVHPCSCFMTYTS